MEPQMHNTIEDPDILCNMYRQFTGDFDSLVGDSRAHMQGREELPLADDDYGKIEPKKELISPSESHTDLGGGSIDFVAKGVTEIAEEKAEESIGCLSICSSARSTPVSAIAKCPKSFDTVLPSQP